MYLIERNECVNTIIKYKVNKYRNNNYNIKYYKYNLRSLIL